MILNEELHIAGEVLVLSNYIKSKILATNTMKGGFTITSDEYERYLYQQGYKAYDSFLFFNEIKVYYFISNFEYGENINLLNSSSNNIDAVIENDKIKIRCSVLRLYLGLVNNQVEPTIFEEIIQHEINHIYQTFLRFKANSEQPYSKQTVNKWSRVYELAKNNIKNTNPYISALSHIFYYLDSGEQDSYSNGLYSNLMNQKQIKDLDSFLQTTRQYKTLNYLRNIEKSIPNWNQYDTEVIEAKNLFYGKQAPFKEFINSIKNYLSNQLKKYEKKLGGVVMKYKKDSSMTTEGKIKNMGKKIGLLEQLIMLRNYG